MALTPLLKRVGWQKLSEELGNYKVIEAITKENAVDTLKAVCMAADDMLAEESSVKLFVPKHVLFDYCEDYKSTTGAIPYNREYKQYYVEGFDNVNIVPLANKKNSPFIHMTVKRNMLVGVNQTGEEENVEVARFKAFVLQFIATMFSVWSSRVCPRSVCWWHPLTVQPRSKKEVIWQQIVRQRIFTSH